MIMKETIIQVMNNKMDKCTTEQFWVVAAITGLNAFLIINSKVVSTYFAKWQILLFTGVFCCYGLWFVINRHRAYWKLQKDLVDYLHEENNLPTVLREKPWPWSFKYFSGVALYSLIILVTSVGTLLVILDP